MKIFTFEPQKGKASTKETVIILDKKEGQLLVHMLEYAAKNNSRKKTWETFSKEFLQRLCCF